MLSLPSEELICFTRRNCPFFDISTLCKIDKCYCIVTLTGFRQRTHPSRNEVLHMCRLIGYKFNDVDIEVWWESFFDTLHKSFSYPRYPNEYHNTLYRLYYGEKHIWEPDILILKTLKD